MNIFNLYKPTVDPNQVTKFGAKFWPPATCRNGEHVVEGLKDTSQSERPKKTPEN